MKKIIKKEKEINKLMKMGLMNLFILKLMMMGLRLSSMSQRLLIWMKKIKKFQMTKN